MLGRLSNLGQKFTTRATKGLSTHLPSFFYRDPFCRYTAINFKAHTGDSVRASLAAQMKLYKTGGQYRANSNPIHNALISDLLTVCVKIRLHHYPAGLGKMAYHADNEARDADKHTRFSMLYFASREMQQYVC